ncbi:MAG: hypothetical protein AAF743_00675 [Planctomycetota bacterium]
MQTNKDIAERLNRKPFHPFRIKLSSGEEFVVHSPELVFLAGMDLHIGFDPDDSGIPTRSSLIAVEQVTSLSAISKSIVTPSESAGPKDNDE